MNYLVNIDGIPPLRQSTEAVMSCPRYYLETFIKGRKQPSGLESKRGTDVHSVLARYASWCAHKGVAQDLSAFDEFAKGVGPQAAKILVGMRDGYAVHHDNLLATEIPLALDENLQPTNVPDALNGSVTDSGLPACYQGTLDALYVFNRALILIDDAKTHVRPFDPGDTLQGQMYALFAFTHFPWVDTVTFRLVFVRYKNLTRDVTYTRFNDLDKIIEMVRLARARQEMIHRDYERGEEIEAIAGGHCVWCPLLSDRSCPIAEYNPQAQLSPKERLNFALWYKAFSAANNRAMKDHVDGTGKPIVLKDYNGKAYMFGPTETESEVYPLFKKGFDGIETNAVGRPAMPIVDLLEDYIYATPDDTEWMGNITLSATSIKSYLKAKKRVHLHQAIEDTCEKVTKVKLAISKPLDTLPEDGEEEEEEEIWA